VQVAVAGAAAAAVAHAGGWGVCLGGGGKETCSHVRHNRSRSAYKGRVLCLRSITSMLAPAPYVSNKHAVVCCAVLCCAVLCCAVLCCAVLYCASLSCQAVPGFQDAIREYVLHSIGISFRRVNTRVLADWLKLEPPALKQLLADKVSSCCSDSAFVMVCGKGGTAPGGGGLALHFRLVLVHLQNMN
jgi:hypothetical protein